MSHAHHQSSEDLPSHRHPFIGVIAILILLAALLPLGGCVFVRPSDAALIDSAAANARAYARAVAADPTIPAGTQSWIAQDAAQWTYFSDWANGRAPVTQPASSP